MVISSGISEEAIKSLVKAFSDSVTSLVKEIEIQNDLETGNFKNGGAWDIRFTRIKKAALQHELVVITRKRGMWTFIMVLNINTGVLYIFSKEKNFDIVVRNFGKHNIHYFHAFVSKNSGPMELDNQQMQFFSTLPDDYDVRRIEEVQKILAEDYSSVKEVVFVIGKEEDKKIVEVEAKYYNPYFELLDTENWSEFIAKDHQYEDIFIPNRELDEDEPEEKPVIPTVKKNIKSRKDLHDKQIPETKKEKDDLDEEKKS